MAAVSLSQRHLTQLQNIFPNFPLDTMYNMVLMDCPWQYEGERNKPPYPCLSQKELKLLPLKQITTTNSILLMWCTGPMKDKALELIKAYGFTYQQTLFTWVKQKKGKNVSIPGKYSNTCTEELLIATRGQVSQYVRQNHKVEQIQYAEVGQHSEKPFHIMKQLSKVFTLDKMNSLEIFARKRTLKDFDLYGNELKPQFQPTQTSPKINNISCQLPQIEIAERIKTLILLFEDSPSKVYRKYINALKDLFKISIGVFAFTKQEFGLTDMLQHRIQLTKDARPQARHPYKMADKEHDFIKKEIDMLLKLGCIEPATSEWASCVVLVRKQNGDYRMCIDYRPLNSLTIRDQFPLPRIDQVLILICQGKVFTKLDLKSGFWQVSVYMKDRPKTAFVCKWGTYQWKRMPFGLTNAPATFQRLMELILAPYLNKFCLVYIDDIIIFSQNVEEHLEHVRLIIEALAEANLKIGHDKCIFMQDKIEILGHEVCNGKYTPLASRVSAITRLERPTDVKGVQIFLGMVNYHGQFIKDLAKKAKPLRQLTRKGVQFVWTLECQKAFEQLKQIIATKPILHIPIAGKLMVLYTDFSQQGIGAVLSQVIDEKVEKVIEYASRTLKTHEVNYPAYKGEVLAVKWALQKFRQFLLQAPFRLVLDNQAAVDLLKQRHSPTNLNNLQKTVLNWVLEMSEFEFEPIHRAGVSHNNADALSRLKVSQIYDLPQGFQPSCNADALSYLNIIDIPQFNYFNWWGHDNDAVCIKCLEPDTSDKNDILICDYCMKNIHQNCHNPKVQKIPLGAWYCKECTLAANQLEQPDVTLDFSLIQYLQGSPLPTISQARQNQILERAHYYYYQNHRLRLRKNNLVVPTYTERNILMNQIHDTKGHCSADALYDTIIQEYYWETLKQDVAKLNTACAHCSQMNPKYLPNPSLHPTEKGERPMSILHIDLSGDLQVYPTSRKNRYICIIIDAFSKWIEIYPIPNKRSETTAQCMWDFIKTYGSPTIVRSDKGGEFQGDFTQLLNDLRVEFITISTSNPQANGQVERTIQTAKAALRRFVNSPTQKVEWDEAATAIQMSINSTPSQTTKYSPYEIVFGRAMAFPSSVVVDPPLEFGLEPNFKRIDDYVKALKIKFKSFHPQVRANILEADARNKRLYDKRNARHLDKQHQFRNGDYVLIRIPKVTKLGPKGKGPFIFVKYSNKDKLTSELLDPTKAEKQVINNNVFYKCKTFTYSTSNLAKVKYNQEQFDISKLGFEVEEKQS